MSLWQRIQNGRIYQVEPEDIFADVANFTPREDVSEPLKLRGLH